MILSKFFIKQNLEGKIKDKNKKILELGGGTGYLSIVLGALGMISWFILRGHLKKRCGCHMH